MKLRSLKDYGYSVVLISISFLTSCATKSDSNQNSFSVKFEQYYIQGKLLYTNNCSNCHQPTGTGLGLIYPPLNTSDYMEKNFKEVLCLIKNGRQGELIVNGKSFIQAMPGIPSLTDLEIAEIATYIYNTWDHHKGIVEVKEVTRALGACE